MKPRHRKLPSKAMEAQMALDSAVVRGASEEEITIRRKIRDEVFNDLAGWAKIIVKEDRS